MTARAVIACGLAALALIGACGEVTSSAGAASGADASADAVADVARPADASDASDAAMIGDGSARCDGSTYTSAPSGGACDPSHIKMAYGRTGQCLAPTGGFCDVMQFSVQALDAASVPSGFACGSAELGVTTCRWQFPDGGAHDLDSAALDAACAVTQAFAGADVMCIVYD